MNTHDITCSPSLHHQDSVSPVLARSPKNLQPIPPAVAAAVVGALEPNMRSADARKDLNFYKHSQGHLFMKELKRCKTNHINIDNDNMMIM